MIVGPVLLVFGIVVLIWQPSWAAAPDADLYVSTVGNDAWSGRFPEAVAGGTDGPVATVEQAKQRVRELRKRQPGRDRPVVVAIRGGTYNLDRPLRFGPEDSGTQASPTVYQGFGEERPVLSGGIRITEWQVTPEGHWRATVEDVRSGKFSFAQLFVNGQRRERSRLPKEGYYSIAVQLGNNQFGFTGDEIRADWANLDDVEVLAIHKWSASRMRIASVFPTEHRVVFTGRSWEPLPRGHRYVLFNVREALNEPGQWYLDRRRGELTYIPRAGERPDRVVVIAPRLDQVMVLQGDLGNKRWVQHIRFSGLTFAHTNWTLPPHGQSFPQAEIGLNAAIVAIGAREIVIESCSVTHVGGYGVAFGRGSRDNRLENCELVDLGGGGVKIGHAGAGTWQTVMNRPDDPELQVSRHVVRNCLIAHGGRLHPGAVGIWIGESSYNSIEHNDIFDFYQTGISVGWTWGYEPSDAHHNDIGFNHIHTIGQGIMSDMGGVYTLGVQPGTVVHDNVIHDIQSFGYGGWGLYADEGSTDIVMERNLVYRTKTGGFFQHFGKENRIRNNIFAFATQFQLEATEPAPHISFRFERNILYWDNSSPVLGGCQSASPPCGIGFEMDHNVYWNAAGTPPLFPGNLGLSDWQENHGQDRHSVIADPLFVDAKNDDFQLRANSPALQMSFRPLDPTKAGREPLRATKELPQASERR